MSHIEALESNVEAGKLPNLLRTVILTSTQKHNLQCSPFQVYAKFILSGKKIPVAELQAAETLVNDDDVVNMQFTSGKDQHYYNFVSRLNLVGTTGNPKAAMLTHRYISAHNSETTTNAT